jgi:deoxyribodipyrimidine photo-lyase
MPSRIARLSTDPRVTIRQPGEADVEGRAIVYWMQRSQRAWDNPALDVAIELGNLLRKPVVAFLGVHPFVEGANLRHYHFLADGLADIADGLRARRVGFVLRVHPRHRLAPFLDEVRPAIVIGDENPLRQMERWRERVAETIAVPCWTVDADVVVPSMLLETEQYAARTIRPRIHRHLDQFLVASSEPVAHVAWAPDPAPATVHPASDMLATLPLDRRVGPVSGLRGGLGAARAHLRAFVAQGLRTYDEGRNHPEVDGTSRLSPYLHFGHIGPREVALAVRDSGGPPASVAAYVEQLIVRRELAINFVRFNPAYDRLNGCEAWARRTLEQHRLDPRPYGYTAAELEAAATHDPLWNAAQRQMAATGWMHGYLRMYWAKKILEWSDDPAAAFEVAIALNDRYELDGRDPNGYASIAWAIGGKHDRPWPSRPIYGVVRSMSFASTSRKFDAARYIEQFGGGSARPLTARPARRAR